MLVIVISVTWEPQPHRQYEELWRCEGSPSGFKLKDNSSCPENILEGLKTKTIEPVSYSWGILLRSSVLKSTRGNLTWGRMQDLYPSLPLYSLLSSPYQIHLRSSHLCPWELIDNLVKGPLHLVFHYIPALGTLAWSSADGGLRLMPCPYLLPSSLLTSQSP